MAGSHKYAIEFVAEVDKIVQQLQEALDKISKMRATIQVDFVGPGGTPIEDFMNRRLPTPSAMLLPSPGSTSSGPQAGGRPSPAAPIAGNGTDDRSPWQRFRQDDPAYQLMNFNRATSERERHISMMTGGRGVGSFLGDQISAAERKGDEASLSALREFRKELVENAKELAKQREILRDATGAGDVGRARDAAREIEERTRIKEAMVQSAGGGGGGGGGGGILGGLGGIGGAMAGALAFMGGAAAIRTAKKIISEIEANEIKQAQALTAGGQGMAALIGAGTTFSAESAIRLDPEVMLQARIAAAKTGATLNPMNLARHVGRGLTGRDYVSQAEAKAANAVFEANLQSRAGDLKDLGFGIGRMDMRRGLTAPYGMSQDQMALEYQRFTGPLSLQSGFLESEIAGAMAGGLGAHLGQGRGGLRRLQDIFSGADSPFGKPAGSNIGLAMLARGTGISLDETTRLTGGVAGFGRTDEGARAELVSVMAKGVEQGVVGAGLVKMTDQLVQLAQTSGVGAASMQNYLPFLQAGLEAGGPAFGGSVAATTVQRLQGQMRTTGGLQGVVNMLTAKDAVDAAFDGDPIAKEKAAMMLMGHSFDEWGSEAVFAQLFKIPGIRPRKMMFPAVGGQGIGMTARNFGQFGAQRNIQYRNQINQGVSGFTDPVLAQMFSNEPGLNLEASILDAQTRQGILNNPDVNTSLGEASLRASAAINAQDVGLAARAAADVAEATRGIQAFDKVVEFSRGLQDAATAISNMSTKSQGFREELEKMTDAMAKSRGRLEAEKIIPPNPGKPTKAGQ